MEKKGLRKVSKFYSRRKRKYQYYLKHNKRLPDYRGYYYLKDKKKLIGVLKILEINLPLKIQKVMQGKD